MDIGPLGPKESAKTLSSRSWAPAPSPLHPPTPRLCFHQPLLALTHCLLADSAHLWTTAGPASRELPHDQGDKEAKRTKRPAEPLAQPSLPESGTSPGHRPMLAGLIPPLQWSEHDGGGGLACAPSPIPLCCLGWLSLDSSWILNPAASSSAWYSSVPSFLISDSGLSSYIIL